MIEVVEKVGLRNSWSILQQLFIVYTVTAGKAAIFGEGARAVFPRYVTSRHATTTFSSHSHTLSTLMLSRLVSLPLYHTVTFYYPGCYHGASDSHQISITTRLVGLASASLALSK